MALTVLPDLSEKKTLYSRDSAAPSSLTVYSAETTLQTWNLLLFTADLCTKDWCSGAALKEREAAGNNAVLCEPFTTDEFTHCGKWDTHPAAIALAAAIVT